MPYTYSPSKLTQILHANGHAKIKVTSVTEVFGGSINKTYEVQTNGDSLFLKVNDSPHSHDMFKAESRGLELLAKHAKLNIPKPLFITEQEKDHLFFMTHLNGQSNAGDAYTFGVELAQMHKTTNNRFGLSHDNYMGSLPQQNNFQPTWGDFFILNRLQPQAKLARDQNRITAETVKKLDRFYGRMNEIFPEENPALIHGDLWSGNFMFTDKGPSMFDPAVAFAHREQDLAMTKLFGAFPVDFYNGYLDTFPVENGFEQRTDAYNLYPILIHVNLFGGGYAHQFSTMLDNYV